jgi:hypothetical protein
MFVDPGYHGFPPTRRTGPCGRISGSSRRRPEPPGLPGRGCTAGADHGYCCALDVEPVVLQPSAPAAAVGVVAGPQTVLVEDRVTSPDEVDGSVGLVELLDHGGFCA